MGTVESNHSLKECSDGHANGQGESIRSTSKRPTTEIEYPQTEVQEAVLYRSSRETRAIDYVADVDD